MMKYNGTCGTCALECTETMRCKVTHFKTKWSDPCHCPDLRAQAIADQFPEGMVMVRRGVAARACMLLWDFGCVNAANRLASDLGSTDGRVIKQMMRDADDVELERYEVELKEKVEADEHD